jgi:hypothetical protein
MAADTCGQKSGTYEQVVQLEIELDSITRRLVEVVRTESGLRTELGLQSGKVAIELDAGDGRLFEIA